MGGGVEPVQDVLPAVAKAGMSLSDYGIAGAVIALMFALFVFLLRFVLNSISSRLDAIEAQLTHQQAPMGVEQVRATIDEAMRSSNLSEAVRNMTQIVAPDDPRPLCWFDHRFIRAKFDLQNSQFQTIENRVEALIAVIESLIANEQEETSVYKQLLAELKRQRHP